MAPIEVGRRAEGAAGDGRGARTAGAGRKGGAIAAPTRGGEQSGVGRSRRQAPR